METGGTLVLEFVNTVLAIESTIPLQLNGLDNVLIRNSNFSSDGNHNIEALIDLQMIKLISISNSVFYNFRTVKGVLHIDLSLGSSYCNISIP